MAISSESQVPLSLPIIDFSNPDLKPETPEWDLVRSQVRKALEEYGCFEALFDGASMELRKALFESSKEVFDLPLETKLSTKTDVHYEGYLTIPRVPIQEGMGFYGIDNPNVVNDLTHKLWPQGNIFVGYPSYHLKQTFGNECFCRLLQNYLAFGLALIYSKM